MESQTDIKALLLAFNQKGYADPDTVYLDNGKDGKVLKHVIDSFTYEDEFYGGEPYCGNETIWNNGKVIFRCIYWGKVDKDSSFSEVYTFLKKALRLGPNGVAVHRGPEEFKEGEFKYSNISRGDIHEFYSEERIFINEKEVYFAYFIGGDVNLRK